MLLHDIIIANFNSWLHYWVKNSISFQNKIAPSMHLAQAQESISTLMTQLDYISFSVISYHALAMYELQVDDNVSCSIYYFV